MSETTPHEAGRLAVQWGRQQLCSGDVLLGLVRLGPLNPPVSERKGLLCPQPCPVSALTQGPGLHGCVLYPRLPRTILLCLWTSAPCRERTNESCQMWVCGAPCWSSDPLRSPELCLLLRDRKEEGRMYAELCGPSCPRRTNSGKLSLCFCRA